MEHGSACRATGTMKLSPHIPGKRYSSATPSIVGIVWLALLMMPCAMVLDLNVSGTASTASTFQPVLHADGYVSAHAHSSQGSDCDCELTDVLSLKSADLSELATVFVNPIETVTNLPRVLAQVAVGLQHDVTHSTSPPIYLATQRLRI